MLPFPEILLTAVQLDATWLAVLIAVAFEAWRQKSETVALPSGVLERAGVNKRARGRALRRLVELEIVEVVRPSGKAPMVTLVWKRPVPRMTPGWDPSLYMIFSLIVCAYPYILLAVYL
jgi:hypothetical protein